MSNTNEETLRLETRMTYSGERFPEHNGSILWMVYSSRDNRIKTSCLCVGKHCVTDWYFEDIDITDLPFVRAVISADPAHDPVGAVKNLAIASVWCVNEFADEIFEYWHTIEGDENGKLQIQSEDNL